MRRLALPVAISAVLVLGAVPYRVVAFDDQGQVVAASEVVTVSPA